MSETTRGWMPRLRWAVGIGVLSLTFAGCGNGDGADTASNGEGGVPTPSTSSAAARIGDCAADDPAVTAAAVVGKVDLTGSGPIEVKLTGDGSCPGVLFARDGDTTYQVTVPGAIDPRVRGISLKGRDGQLLVATQSHPRGGVQTRVFVADGDTLHELTNAEGNPLAPFVATDTSNRVAVLDCTADGKLALVSSRQSGAREVWQLVTTTYAVDGARAVKGATTTKTMPLGGFAKAHPEFQKGTSFTHCT